MTIERPKVRLRAEEATMGTVLVIDDSESWFSAIAVECEKAGYSAMRVSDSDEAIDFVTRQPPLLIVVDVLIAAKAGASFIRQLRSLPSMSNTPMLLTTAGVNAKTARLALGVTSEEIIPKNKRALETFSEKLRKLPLSA